MASAAYGWRDFSRMKSRRHRRATAVWLRSSDSAPCGRKSREVAQSCGFSAAGCLRAEDSGRRGARSSVCFAAAEEVPGSFSGASFLARLPFSPAEAGL
eukprot:scaffold536_cov250-Pinguiococcus_pyrenoidosus.AAC.25